MDLTQLANLGEFIGGLAVLVTLVYLAVQVRHTNMLTRIGTHRDVDESLSSFLGDLAKDKGLHEIWFKGTQGSEALDEKERDRFGMVLYQLFVIYSTMYHSATLNRSLTLLLENMIDRDLGRPSVQQWWSRQRSFQAEPFRSFVDQRLSLLLATKAEA